MKETRERKTNITHRKEPHRLVALSDGLFATVLTLLVLDLRLPDALSTISGNSSVFLKWLGPHLFSYLLTFLVGGTYWIAHHRNFDQVETYDRGLMGYNLLFLLFIGLLPFSTAAISLPSFSSAFPFYWAIYASNMILAGIMLNLTWNYAVSHHLVNPETTRKQSQQITARQIVTPAVFLVSIVADFLFPQFFLGPYTLLIIPLGMWGVDRYYAGTQPKKSSRFPGWGELMWRAGSMIPWILIIGFAVWAVVH
jgi:uncharacterized membrane protein